jgi:hypothetical protein
MEPLTSATALVLQPELCTFLKNWRAFFEIAAAVGHGTGN